MADRNQDDYMKVHLPGESLWAKVTRWLPDGSFIGEIDNEPVGSADEARRLAVTKQFFPDETEPVPKTHDFKQGEAVCFVRHGGVWVPKEIAGNG